MCFYYKELQETRNNQQTSGLLHSWMNPSWQVVTMPSGVKSMPVSLPEAIFLQTIGSSMCVWSILGHISLPRFITSSWESKYFILKLIYLLLINRLSHNLYIFLMQYTRRIEELGIGGKASSSVICNKTEWADAICWLKIVGYF